MGVQAHGMVVVVVVVGPHAAAAAAVAHPATAQRTKPPHSSAADPHPRSRRPHPSALRRGLCGVLQARPLTPPHPQEASHQGLQDGGGEKGVRFRGVILFFSREGYDTKLGGRGWGRMLAVLCLPLTACRG